MLQRLFSLCLLFIVSTSCSLSNDGCEPFDDKFKTVDFYTDLNTITFSEGPEFYINYSSLESETVRYEEFGISMFPVMETYSSFSASKFSFSIIPTAYACSLLPPDSEETITGIQIFSNQTISSSYGTDKNLAPLFDVVVLYHSSGYERMDLGDFLASEPYVPSELFLILKSEPESDKPVRFTISYTQDGLEMSEYEITTQPVTFVK